MSSYDAEFHRGWEQGLEQGREIANKMYQDGLSNNPIDKIANWNVERNLHTIIPDDSTVIYCKLEETFEFLGINKCFADDKQFKKLVNKYKTYILEEAEALGATATIEEKVDALNDDTVFNSGFVLRYGYNPTKALNETVKEIDSRTGVFDEDTGKWSKLKTPEAKALWYTAEYSSCLNS